LLYDSKIRAYFKSKNTLKQLIENIKAREENDRMKAMYLRFPEPDAKP